MGDARRPDRNSRGVNHTGFIDQEYVGVQRIMGKQIPEKQPGRAIIEVSHFRHPRQRDEELAAALNDHLLPVGDRSHETDSLIMNILDLPLAKLVSRINNDSESGYHRDQDEKYELRPNGPPGQPLHASDSLEIAA
jgi:hypothetical protein